MDTKEKKYYEGHEVKNLGDTSYSPAEQALYTKRQKDENDKMISIRVRNLSPKLLSREIKFISIEVALSASLMRKAEHIWDDVDANAKIDKYCKIKGINRNKLNLSHIAGANK